MEGFVSFLVFSFLVILGMEAVFAHQELVAGIYVVFGSAAMVTLIHKIRHP
jgi:hypothetical protein